jgi:hypothetical protein
VHAAVQPGSEQGYTRSWRQATSRHHCSCARRHNDGVPNRLQRLETALLNIKEYGICISAIVKWPAGSAEGAPALQCCTDRRLQLDRKLPGLTQPHAWQNEHLVRRFVSVCCENPVRLRDRFLKNSRKPAITWSPRGSSVWSVQHLQHNQRHGSNLYQ